MVTSDAWITVAGCVGAAVGLLALLHWSYTRCAGAAMHSHYVLPVTPAARYAADEALGAGLDRLSAAIAEIPADPFDDACDGLIESGVLTDHRQAMEDSRALNAHDIDWTDSERRALAQLTAQLTSEGPA